MSIKRRNYGRNHGYLIDGVRAVGVTTALQTLNKPALMLWAAKSVARRVLDMDAHDLADLRAQPGEGGFWELANTPLKERNDAAVRGTKVHYYAEKMQAGEPIEVPEEFVGHVQAAARFLDDWKVTPLLSETVVGDYPYHYAGTFDLVGELPGGRRVLFDYKTGKSGIWPETALQLAAYRYASHYVSADGVTEIPMREVGIEQCKAVHLRADGYDVYPLVCDITVFGTFINILKTHRGMLSAPHWVGDIEQPAVAA